MFVIIQINADFLLNSELNIFTQETVHPSFIFFKNMRYSSNNLLETSITYHIFASFHIFTEDEVYNIANKKQPINNLIKYQTRDFTSLLDLKKMALFQCFLKHPLFTTFSLFDNKWGELWKLVGMCKNASEKFCFWCSMESTFWKEGAVSGVLCKNIFLDELLESEYLFEILQASFTDKNS